MAGEVVPGRELREADRLSRVELKARIASLIRAVKDPAAGQTLELFFRRLYG